MSSPDSTAQGGATYRISPPFDILHDAESQSLDAVAAPRPAMRSRVPAAPSGVILRAPVLDPATGEQARDKYKRLMFREYTCRTVYAGRLDTDDNDFQDIWQVVCHRWMHPGDQVVADFLPARAVLIGPPPAVQSVEQEASHA